MLLADGVFLSTGALIVIALIIILFLLWRRR
jgi:hypothetical protein